MTEDQKVNVYGIATLLGLIGCMVCCDVVSTQAANNMVDLRAEQEAAK